MGFGTLTQDDKRSHGHTYPSPKPVREPGLDGERGDLSDGLNTVEETEDRPGGGVEIALPRVEGSGGGGQW
jgi:hypothetical protein